MKHESHNIFEQNKFRVETDGLIVQFFWKLGQKCELLF
jgi:hypothetical protein